MPPEHAYDWLAPKLSFVRSPRRRCSRSLRIARRANPTEKSDMELLNAALALEALASGTTPDRATVLSGTLALDSLEAQDANH